MQTEDLDPVPAYYLSPVGYYVGGRDHLDWWS